MGDEVSTKRVRLALQKSGRMADDCFKLFDKSGLTIDRQENDLHGSIKELPIDVAFVRSADIPEIVKGGYCDIGIVGSNAFYENRLTWLDFEARVMQRLGFSECRLVLAAPESSGISSVYHPAALRIATSYPNQLRDFLSFYDIDFDKLDIFVMNGSVELAPRLGIAPIICDIVSSGKTLRDNGLKEFETVSNSQALLIRAHNRYMCPAKNAVISRFEEMIVGALPLRKEAMPERPAREVGGSPHNRWYNMSTSMVGKPEVC